MCKYIICFLTVSPCELFYNFSKTLKNNNTDVYICIDNNNYDIPNYDNYINIIKLDNHLCEEAGFKSSVLWLDNKSCSRDKALYYFCKNNLEYEYIWFIEEDVFIPSIHTIENINNKYNTGDLLTSGNDIIYEKKYDWHWNHINNQIKIPPPYGVSAICAIRCPKKIMDCIHDYANKYNNLFMDEALFNTLAIQNNLNIICPNELSSIVWRRNWIKNDILESNLYHPIKDIQTQYNYRNNE